MPAVSSGRSDRGEGVSNRASPVAAFSDLMGRHPNSHYWVFVSNRMGRASLDLRKKQDGGRTFSWRSLSFFPGSGAWSDRSDRFLFGAPRAER